MYTSLLMSPSQNSHSNYLYHLVISRRGEREFTFKRSIRKVEDDMEQNTELFIVVIWLGRIMTIFW